MAPSRSTRLVLFIFAATTLVVAAIALSRSAPPDPLPSTRPSAATRRSPAAAPPTGVRRHARRFLTAFLAYEVGAADRGLRRAIRATATRAFATELLRRPPRQPDRLLPPARIDRIAVAVVQGPRPFAIVSGSARRGHAGEQFAFLFETRHGGWLVAGPAQ